MFFSLIIHVLKMLSVGGGGPKSHRNPTLLDNFWTSPCCDQGILLSNNLFQAVTEEKYLVHNHIQSQSHLLWHYGAPHESEKYNF